MQAAFTKPGQSNARNLDIDKERVDTMRVVGRLSGKDELSTVVEARFYMARRSDGASPVYCSLWVHGNQYTSGYGKASGYGYHKSSAALQDAIDSAGIALTGDQYERDESPERQEKPARIDGCGDSAMRGAMRAIAIAAGADAKLLHVE